MSPVIGVLLHAVGGFFHGSFYLPFSKVKEWNWEMAWITQGLFAWVITPYVISEMTTSGVLNIFSACSTEQLVWPYIFGMMWGLGSLTFGLTMRYLGMSLGMSIALGYCTAFGTIIPVLFAGDAVAVFGNVAGMVILAGLVICLLGIATCGYAGVLKERGMSAEEKRAAIKEFALKKGLLIALFSGIMSAGFAYGINAGQDVAAIAVAQGTEDVFRNSPVFVLVMGGGFTINLIWCSLLMVKNKSLIRDLTQPPAIILNNLFFTILSGVMWYTGFFFYGMGTTKMGDYDFSSWSLHMAFVIIFSNVCGLLQKEWKGSSSLTIRCLSIGLTVLVISTLIIACGSNMQGKETEGNSVSKEDILKKLSTDFATPPNTSKPDAFWCWLNGDVTKEPITNDLEEMKDKGMSGAEVWDIELRNDMLGGYGFGGRS